MTRLNYLRAPARDALAAHVQLDARTRTPLGALAAALLAVATIGFVEDARFVATQRRQVAAHARLDALAARLARTRALAADVTRLRALDRDLDELAASGARTAARLALLGDRVPSDAWLTTIRIAGHELALEGRGTRLAAVGATLATLRRTPGYRAARLVSVRHDALHAGFLYTIALDAAP
ncbi:MAG: PilN domain-containing protein [Vulcanimicrobiaceae bacterium]|jgi:Tfp pilus assembly protein PilN